MAATVPWPSADPGAWEILYLGGTLFPGLAFVKVKGGQKIDVKDGPGADGESTTQQGEKAKVVTITHRLWLPSHWEEMESKFQVIEPAIGKRKPLDIVTAATAARRVSAILIEDVAGPDWEPEKRWMEYSYTCKEHKPPPPKSATAKNTSSQSYPHTIAEANRRDPWPANDTNGRLLIGQAAASAAQGFIRPGT